MSATSELIASIFGLRTLLGPVVDEYMRTTSWISFTWFWMRPTWPRRSEVVTLMSAAGPAARGAAISSNGAQSAACGGGASAHVWVAPSSPPTCSSVVGPERADRGKTSRRGASSRNVPELRGQVARRTCDALREVV